MREIQQTWLRALAPPPKLTVSQWADQNRKLSAEASAEPGQWSTDRAPYQREMMDVFNDPTVHTVVGMTSAQVGKTEIINNVVGYFIDQDPCPILVMQPTESMGETWSKDRLAPMIRDTPVLAAKITDPKARNSGNTILHKSFAGGHVTIVGANAPAGLASRPIRIVLPDEVDRYPASAGTEGDPVNLAKKRTTTFWNRKLGMFSTPGNKGTSRIEKAWEESDQRRYFVPCPHCDESQVFRWSQVQWPEGKPEEAYYVCIACGCLIQDAHKMAMLRKGEWRATKPFRGIAGFHLNEMYSPWRKFGEIASDFLEAKRSGNPELLKTWINTSLGETWEDKGESIESDSLMSRREHYAPVVSQDAMFLTAGVDVQGDRVEIEVVAWGMGQESWSMDYRVIYGDPSKLEWWEENVDPYLLQEWEHESGRRLRIAAACVDTGGHWSNTVYKFCKERNKRRVFAIRGKSQPNNPIVGKPTKHATAGKLFALGVDTAKELIYSRLKILEPGPGYCHFDEEIHDQAYFDMLTAEEIKIKFDKGFPRRYWYKPQGTRNEALDCRVYALAALEILKPVWKKLKKIVMPKTPDPIEETPENDSTSSVEEVLAPEPEKQKPAKKKRRQRRSSGFVNSWRL